MTLAALHDARHHRRHFYQPEISGGGGGGGGRRFAGYTLAGSGGHLRNLRQSPPTSQNNYLNCTIHFVNKACFFLTFPLSHSLLPQLIVPNESLSQKEKPKKKKKEEEEEEEEKEENGN